MKISINQNLFVDYAVKPSLARPLIETPLVLFTGPQSLEHNQDNQRHFLFHPLITPSSITDKESFEVIKRQHDHVCAWLMATRYVDTDEGIKKFNLPSFELYLDIMSQASHAYLKALYSYFDTNPNEKMPDFYKKLREDIQKDVKKNIMKLLGLDGGEGGKKDLPPTDFETPFD